ncbi:hypothetical protein CAMGR0001_0949 [Campylobacter gracilis RM3268]|uniref:Uncharacterized protein n=1 Tax=Campylobacter gracilis RM3268 TaxID=553220 RepID=C8PGF6_9BACT|nr:hypothetical protein CAMGR0001_0949 [Campylobacter gracilis RM3268]
MRPSQISFIVASRSLKSWLKILREISSFCSFLPRDSVARRNLGLNLFSLNSFSYPLRNEILLARAGFLS